MEKFSKLDYLDGLRGADLSAGEYRVLTTMLGYANSRDGKDARPGVTLLMGDCNMSESTVERHLKSLVKKRWLKQARRGGRNGAGTAWASSYELTTPTDSTRQKCRDDSDSQPVKPCVSTRQNESLNPSICAPQPVTSDPPPGSLPGLITRSLDPEERYVSNAGARDTVDRIAEWSRSHSSDLDANAESMIYDSDCEDYYGEECA
jgi:predicted transcriptional regulator